MNQSTQPQPNIPAGDYQNSKANPDTIEVGFSENKNAPQMILQCWLPDIRRELSVILTFASPQNAQISMEMLRATGWSGADLNDLTGIGTKEFTVRVKYEVYDGEQQMRTSILTGGGRISFKADKKTDLRTFAAAVARVTGNTTGGGGSGSPPPPPFG